MGLGSLSNFTGVSLSTPQTSQSGVSVANTSDTTKVSPSVPSSSSSSRIVALTSDSSGVTLSIPASTSSSSSAGFSNGYTGGGSSGVTNRVSNDYTGAGLAASAVGSGVAYYDDAPSVELSTPSGNTGDTLALPSADWTGTTGQSEVDVRVFQLAGGQAVNPFEALSTLDFNEIPGDIDFNVSTINYDLNFNYTALV